MPVDSMSSGSFDGEDLVRSGEYDGRISPYEALDFRVTFRGLINVSRKLSKKVVVAHARIRIRAESQNNLFLGNL